MSGTHGFLHPVTFSGFLAVCIPYVDGIPASHAAASRAVCRDLGESLRTWHRLFCLRQVPVAGGGDSSAWILCPSIDGRQRRRIRRNPALAAGLLVSLVPFIGLC